MEGILQKSGGGAASDECTATRAMVLKGVTAITSDSEDEPVEGTLDVQSILSFRVAAYSTSQVLAAWDNPERGPYSGVVIRCKTGGYPDDLKDGTLAYKGTGSNNAASGTSTAVIGGLAAGTTYYFRAWAYCVTSLGELYGTPLSAACATTASARKVYTSSASLTIPAGVRSISIHCTGGGCAGGMGRKSSSQTAYAGKGGSGGHTAYKTGISVSPGDVLAITVGAGGASALAAGGTSSVSRGGAVLCSAAGGNSSAGGSGGGNCGRISSASPKNAEAGASNGGSCTGGSKGQGTTTREFGSGTLYSGGGGGGGCMLYISGSESYPVSYQAAGGAGGGGRGGSGAQSVGVFDGVSGSAGTGGGGGGGGYCGPYVRAGAAGKGGSGNVIIKW